MTSDINHFDRECFYAYEEIRRQTLIFHDNFQKRYRESNCKKGCAECCEETGILPLEFYYLQKKMRDNNFQINKTDAKENSRCPFLRDGFCQIYEYRPLMCITQGLPLVVPAEDGDYKEVIICELNSHLLERYGDRILVYEYDKMLIMLITYNEVFCKKEKISNRRIPLGRLTEY